MELEELVGRPERGSGGRGSCSQDGVAAREQIAYLLSRAFLRPHEEKSMKPIVEPNSNRIA